MVGGTSDDHIKDIGALEAKNEALESTVKDRARRKRRNNIQFVREDVRRTVAKQHSELPASALRSVFDALMNTHVFMHRDGTPVRTASAPFSLEKNAEEMNVLLTNLYLETLKSLGADLSNTKGLADLFLGNPDRQRVIQETLAWLEQPSDEDLSAIDDLLEVDDDGADEPKPKAKAKKEEAKPKKEEPKAKKEEPKSNDDDDLLVEEDEEPKKKPARKRRTTAKKKTETKADDAKADDAKADDAKADDAEEAPKKKPARKRRTTKKKTETKADDAKASDSGDDASDDDLLVASDDEPEEKPKRKPRRRKAPAKKAEAEAAE